ncbi:MULTISPECIES: rhodanese-like domain-containing protein [Gordonia]|uniref:Rhodanese domain-containing protein n=2 Tax=Gordonia TaxID=2053 RepID=L7LJ46_9ACTN|nr:MULTISPECIES: rhodanese-like domain-containing protein [Gordonia]AUH67929.1 rhodanese-like domain-containing protein [Gordonia sp. YC-JH1]KJR07958.1 sulfurtransferase [Gordonia sihwensis]KXT58664.1 sulfurtransferase [Gordonia sp. QH-12]MBY4571419.1 sulfurtransferase [Gordonia sihwensis]WFN92356.1 rhodanese-like domain-containing protein [Gordonia sihwensis]
MTYSGDVTCEQAWQRLAENPKAVLIDCRTQAEWNFVGVPDTESLGKRTLFVEWIDYPNGAPNPRFVDQLREAGVEPDDELLFLCRSGHRSIGAAEAAVAAGFGQAYNILDGFEGPIDADGHRGGAGWRAASLPWRQS